MSCVVCGLKFSGQECPRCGFPLIEATSEDALHRSVDAPAAAWRAGFLQKLTISLAVQYWQVVGEEIQPAAIQYLPIGTAAELDRHPLPLPVRLARLPEEKHLSLRLRVSCERTHWEKELTVTIENLLTPGFQRIYLSAAGNGCFAVHLTDEAGTIDRASEPVPFL